MNIIQKISDLPELLELIAVNREPYRLSVYVEELAAMIHRYYARYKIVSPKSKELSQARLMLLDTARNVLAIVFELMGISAPEKM